MNECEECPLYDQCAYNGDTAMCLLEEYDEWREYELMNIQARAENVIRQKRILFNGELS